MVHGIKLIDDSFGPKFFLIALLVPIIICTAGCSGNPNIAPYISPFDLSEKNRMLINKINIRVFEPVDPPHVYLPGLYDSFGQIYSVNSHHGIGDVHSSHSSARSHAVKSKSIEFSRYLKKNDISVKNLINVEMKNQLALSSRLKLTNYKNADTILNIYVPSYGFSPIELDSKYQQPFIQLIVHLKNKKNEVIAALYVSSVSFTRLEYAGLELPVFSEKQLYSQSDEVKKALELVSRIAVGNIVDKLIQE